MTNSTSVQSSTRMQAAAESAFKQLMEMPFEELRRVAEDNADDGMYLHEFIAEELATLKEFAMSQQDQSEMKPFTDWMMAQFHHGLHKDNEK